MGRGFRSDHAERLLAGTRERITAPVREFARISGLGQSTIWQMMADGRLEHISVGRRRLVLVDSYHKYIEQQRAGPPRDARRNGTVPAMGSTVARSPPAQNVTIDDLRLSTRARNALANSGIANVDDLVVWSRDQLLRLPNFGQRCLSEVEDALGKLHLRLGMGAAAAE